VARNGDKMRQREKRAEKRGERKRKKNWKRQRFKDP